jgi:3-oxoacyl-[acyl-carrier-protein] synthase II
VNRVPRRRVGITGLGAITPLATGVEESWQRLCQGKSGVAATTKFDTSDFNVKIAAELKNFHPEDFLDKKKIRRTDPFIQYAMVAARLAIRDAGLLINESNSGRVGVVLGSAAGGLTMFGANLLTLHDQGPDRVSPFFIPGFLPNMAVGEVSMEFGIRGPSKCVVTACASGSNCIGDALRLIQYDEADAMIAGGSDAYVIPIAVAGFDKMRALSRRNNEPEKASGAGVVVLEELGSAVQRGAKIYAELIGYGTNIDSFHITDPDWENQARCLKLALSDAAISPSDVDYINAHGTSTVSNDLSETKAIKAILGEHGKTVPVSSSKSMIGHLLAAAGGVEAIFTVLTIRDSIIPPTINYDTPDPECDLDYVPNVARKARIDIAISNSFGFGGVNATLVFRKFQER